MKQIDIEKYLQAMRAEAIPAGWSNVWYIDKLVLQQPQTADRHGCLVNLLPGTITYLRRLTDATLYSNPPGEVVMEDTLFELRTHLGFVLKARGRVLVTGLGLGCVVRGLLANPAVEHVTCIENSRDVLRLVQPYMPTDRLTIIEADALEWTAKNSERFDCAWHDLWTNMDAGEPHLDHWHMRLLMNCRTTVKRQGAWSLDRRIKRKLQAHHLIQWIG